MGRILQVARWSSKLEADIMYCIEGNLIAAGYLQPQYIYLCTLLVFESEIYLEEVKKRRGKVGMGMKIS